MTARKPVKKDHSDDVFRQLKEQVTAFQATNKSLIDQLAKARHSASKPYMWGLVFASFAAGAAAHMLLQWLIP